MDSVRKLFNGFLGFVMAVCASMLAVSTLLSCINVFLRYVLGTSLPWADELSIYLAVVMIFIYQCKLEYEDDQLSISALIEKYKNKRIFIKAVYYLRTVITFVLYIILIRSGITVVNQHLMYNAATPVMRLPFSIITILVTIGLILVIIYWIAELVLRPKKTIAEMEGGQHG